MPARKPDFATGGNLSLAQLGTLVKANRRFCTICMIIGGLVTFVGGMLEVPRYVSAAKLQFKASDTGRSVVQTSINEVDTLGIREFMDRSISVADGDPFRTELAAQAKADPRAKSFELVWGIGSRARLGQMIARLGLGYFRFNRVDISTTTDADLSTLISGAMDIVPDYKEQVADVYFTALDPATAQRINSVILQAFIHTNQKQKANELEKSTNFLEAEMEKARLKLGEANEKLRDFYQENPELLNADGKGNASGERAGLTTKKNQLVDEIEANRKLLAFYNKEYSSFSRNADTTAEVFDRFKQELIELKYKRKKFLFQGYDEKNEGILEIDHRIGEIEKILAADRGGKPHGRLVGVGHEQSVSERIMELQDTLKKQEFELESIASRLGAASTKTESESRSALRLENLKVEARLATTMFEELSKKSEYAGMRRNGDDQQILVKESPSLPLHPTGTPVSLRTLFGTFVGLALAISWLILSSIFSFRLTDRQSVEDLGINFVGWLRDHDANLSEILVNLDCLDRGEDAETHILLCVSPQNCVHHEEVQMLTSFLARQQEKSLFVVIGAARIQPRFSQVADLGFATVYAHQNNMEFILQLSDKETLKSLRECIQILESTYRLKYACVLLYFAQGVADPNYHLGLKLATKVLLLGMPAKYTISEYMKLIYGLRDLNNTNLAFAYPSRRRRRMRNIPNLGSPELDKTFFRPTSFGGKLREIFFD